MIFPTLADWIKNANYLVVLTGAGISTASGLSDFRGPNGVWVRKEKGLKPIPGPPIQSVEPNKGHMALVRLFELGVLKFLISQNVDNLHLKSGVNPDLLVELHGNHSLFKCTSCDSRFTVQELHWNKELYGPGYRKDEPFPDQPCCPYCGGRVISTIVNFGDPMPSKELQTAIFHAKRADVFLVIGSSLVVNPAASLPIQCHNNGGSVIIINKGETPLDQIAVLKLDADIGETMEELINELESSKDI